jgi:hypothetical protein
MPVICATTRHRSMTALSFAEEQLWLADQADPLTSPFVDCAPNLSLVVRLTNVPDQRALEASLNDIARRHDVLRSRFVASDGRPRRVCEPDLRIKLARSEMPGIRREDRLEVATRVLVEDVQRRFDLSVAPLLRASLVALADDEHVLAIAVHHIVFDRWSKRVLALELRELYEAYTTGRTAQLQPLAMQYAEYVQWQRQGLEGRLGQTLLEHWTARLRDVPDLALPTDNRRELSGSTRSGTWWFRIPANDAARLAAMGRRIRGTLATVLLAILNLLLYRVSGADDIAVGVPVSDRRRPELEHMIGLFTNAVVVRTVMKRGMTFLDLLDRVRGNLVEACRYQDMPLGYLRQVLGVQRPLFRVLFNFMPQIPESALELAGLQVEPLTIAPEPESLADVSLNVRPDCGALVCRLVYKADLFSPARIQELGGQFQALVGRILDAPEQSIDA